MAESTGRTGTTGATRADLSGSGSGERRFFGGPGTGRTGLAVFLTAGDPGPELQEELVRVLDDRRIDCLELGVPFPGSVTDGPVLRRSADRALADGTGLAETLALVRRVRPSLRHTRIALLADWAHTVRPLGGAEFVRRVADSGADAVLVHALPPRLRDRHLTDAARAGLPVVTTCYTRSAAGVRDAAARDATAYVYLVAHYGRSGTAPPAGYTGLSAVVGEIRARSRVPVAVGFGVHSRADVANVARAGADAVVVGTAAVAALERATAAGREAAAEFDGFIRSINSDAEPKEGVDQQ